MRSDWQIVLRTWVVKASWRLLALLARDTFPARIEGPCLVLAPHPDDETLGCGASIAQMRKAGRRVRVVAVTDGRASEEKGGWTQESLPARRKQEMLEACARLGVPKEDVAFLGYPDREAGDHIRSIREDLLREIRRFQPVQVLSPAGCDSNGDHRAVAAAFAEAMAVDGRRMLVHEYVIWFAPLGFFTRMLPLTLAGKMRRVATRPEHDVKKKAFDAHASQYGGYEDARHMRQKLWSRFFRPYEMFIERRKA